jgi:hypothetical protein
MNFTNLYKRVSFVCCRILDWFLRNSSCRYGSEIITGIVHNMEKILGFADTLSAMLKTHWDKPRVYIGCMKSGEVFSES